jgi:SpoIIAA-like
MITIMPNLPDYVLGIIASGQVTATDYASVVIPEVERLLKAHERIRLLYQIGDDVSGFTSGAMWEDMKLGLGRLNRWERIALVTDITWIANATSVFGMILPCPVKVFPVRDRAEAEAWIAD